MSMEEETNLVNHFVLLIAWIGEPPQTHHNASRCLAMFGVITGA